MSKDWEEGAHERRVPLPNENPLVVNLYLQWVYTGKIWVPKHPNEADTHMLHNLDVLVDGIAFAERIQDEDFRDAVYHVLVCSLTTPDGKGKYRCPGASVVDVAYGKTCEGSPFRKSLVDVYTLHGESDWVVGAENFDFLKDLARSLLEDRRVRKAPNQHPQSEQSPVSSAFQGRWVI